MSRHPGKWLAVACLLLMLSARASEPPTSAGATPAAETVKEPAEAPLAASFNLRSANVQQAIRAAASTQASFGYRIEPANPSPMARLTAALQQDRPVAQRKTPPPPRLPQRPPPCDGFISCGIESLLGLEDFDDEVYARVERNRLMNQGSFTDRSSINSSVTLPMSNAQAQAAGAPLRP